MQTIFEKTIFEQIDDAKKAAVLAGKVIREIRLSKVETEQLKLELRTSGLFRPVPLDRPVDILGVRVVPFIKASTDF